jgi:hypothetical protein
MRKRLFGGFVLLWLLSGPARATQEPASHAATPVDPTATIVEAFRTHDIVTLTDPPGNVQVQAFLLSLVRDQRFAEAANETASARYQDAIDRFVRGEDVELGVLRRAWEDHTVANSLGTQGGVHRTVRRAVNASITEPRRL